MTLDCVDLTDLDNRDERQFALPDRFDVTRAQRSRRIRPRRALLPRRGSRALANANNAGAGGARLPDIELAGPVERLRSNFVAGIKHMPVRFTPASARSRRSCAP
jgi:cholest-4-en-3-one 26-monooxygenase